MSLARGCNKSPDDLTFIIDASGNTGVGAPPVAPRSVIMPLEYRKALPWALPLRKKKIRHTHKEKNIANAICLFLSSS